MKIAIRACAFLALSACGYSTAPTTTASNLLRDSKISVLFVDFPDGTLCTVVTPSETLSTTAMPGKIDYQALYATSPVTCEAPDGSVYDVNVSSVAPKGAKVALLTAYGTGAIVASSGLTQNTNDNGVTKRQ